MKHYYRCHSRLHVFWNQNFAMFFLGGVVYFDSLSNATPLKGEPQRQQTFQNSAKALSTNTMIYSMTDVIERLHS